MNILFLYSEVMGYTISTLKAIKRKTSAQVSVIYWDKKKLTPFIPEAEGIDFIPKSNFSSQIELSEFVKSFDPAVMYVSGWMDKDYLRIARYMKANGTRTVCGMDTVWKGSFRQFIGRPVLNRILKKTFDFIWVPGTEQGNYARKLGFSEKRILFDLYSADIELFSNSFHTHHSTKKTIYPKNILFVGRLVKLKGVFDLVDGFKRLDRPDWTLTLIGSGANALKDLQSEKVKIMDFQTSDDLVEEVKKAGIFCLPSHFEPWGVVVHEFAACGLPLLLSDKVGSRHAFLVEGKNGFTFNAGNITDLSQTLNMMMELDNSKLYEMGRESSKMAQRITPESSASEFLKLLHDHRY